MSIPARIIQTAKSEAGLSPTARAAAANARLLHPDWDYQFFDDARCREFVAREFPAHLQAFDSIPSPIQRADFFRYLAVYRLGGFYLDLDVFLSRSLDPLRDSTCVFPFEEININRFLRRTHQLDWDIGNYAFGAAPGHPYLLAVIENCLRGLRDPAFVVPILEGIPALLRRDYRILCTTGPGLLTRTLAEYSGSRDGLGILFPPDVCDPASWHQFGPYGVHLMEGSWRPAHGFLRRGLARLVENRAFSRALAQSRRRGPARALPGSPDGVRPAQRPCQATLLARPVRSIRRAASRRFARRPALMRNPRPIISFTFDDFPRSALISGGPILEAHGARGTYYASLGLMGLSAPPGRMFSREDLEAALSRGHELGCHTYHHCHAADTRSAAFHASILENREALARLIPGAPPFLTHSYPIALPRVSTKRRCAPLFAAARGGGQTFNRGILDLNLLSAFFIEQSRDQPAAIFRLIDEAAASRGWLIFATHDISESPSPYGCTPSLFTRIVQHSAASGALNLPVSVALAHVLGTAGAIPSAMDACQSGRKDFIGSCEPFEAETTLPGSEKPAHLMLP